MRKRLYWAIFAGILYGFFELLCFSGLFVLKRTRNVEYTRILKTSLSEKHREILEILVEGGATYQTFSPTLGWTIKKNGASREGEYRANSQGLRADREYELVPPTNVVRIACFGDSFTHSSGVANHETWEECLTRLYPGLEVLNFGVGGYGLDQAFLRYQQDGVPFHPRIVLIGFMSENIFRNVNVFRPFYLSNTKMPLTKPRFTIRDDKLVLLKNPMQELSQYNELLAHPETRLPQLGTNDYFFQTRREHGFFDLIPSVRVYKACTSEAASSEEDVISAGVYDRDSEAYRVTVKIFDAFHESVIRNGSEPVIVLFPNPGDVKRHRKQETTRYAPLREDFKSKGYRYIDLLDAFDTYGRDLSMKELFRGHYSARTDEFVAKHIGRHLEEKGLITQKPPNKQAALETQESAMLPP